MPKGPKGFNIQRRPGTGSEQLSNEERQAKAELEAHLETCSSFVEARDRVLKMAGGEEKGETSKAEKAKLAAEAKTQDEHQGDQGSQHLGDSTATQLQPGNANMQDLFKMVQAMASGFQSMQKWQKEVEEERQTRHRMGEDCNLEQQPTNKASLNWQGFGHFEDEADLEYDAAYCTSDEEDEALIRDLDQGRLLERWKNEGRNELQPRRHLKKGRSPNHQRWNAPAM